MTIQITSVSLALIQDEGRFGYSDVGVPRSGALNRVKYRLATSLLGVRNQPVFEILKGEFSFSSTTNVSVSVVGSADVFIAANKASTNSSFEMQAGQSLKVIPRTAGPVYLAIAGLVVAKELGSTATDTLSGLGPKPIQVGDVFRIEQVAVEGIGSFLNGDVENTAKILRYIPGPNEFSFQDEYKVSTISRIGVRLSGEEIKSEIPSSLSSFPVMPGAIQIPPSGQPVILSSDCGTTGGYMVAGVVIEADLHLLAEVEVGGSIHLQAATIEEAIKANAELEKKLRSIVVRPSGMGAW